MFFKRRHQNEQDIPKIDIIRDVSGTEAAYGLEAMLIHVIHGRGALQRTNYALGNSQHDIDYVMELTLNGQPVVNVQSSGCPTCDSLLASGYGLPEDCPELKQVSDSINEGCTSLTDGLHRMEPLLGLLNSGVYMIADVPYYPADGSGRFFWDVGEPGYSRATGVVWGEDCQLMESRPSFLYPSQPDLKFDSRRVEHYIDIYKQGRTEPHGIAYHLECYMSLLLDGHHKASAAAVLHRQVRAFTIFPVRSWGLKSYHNMRTDAPVKSSQISYLYIGDGRFEASHFTPQQLEDSADSIPRSSGKTIDSVGYGQIFTRRWEDCFTESGIMFPTVEEAAFLKGDIDDIADRYMVDEVYDCPEEIKCLLSYLSRQGDERVKALAMRAARLSYDMEVKEEAFRALDKIKDDEEVDDFFVDYLINRDPYYPTKGDVLKHIADNHWNKI